MFRVLAILGALLALPSYAPPTIDPAIAANAVVCVAALGGLPTTGPADAAYHEGTLVAVTHVGEVKVPRGAKVYRLGVGDEAEIYRVVTKTGDSYVLRHQNQDPELPLFVYKRQMGFLEEVLTDEETGEPLPGDKSFKIVSIAPTADSAVAKLGDARGFTLENMIDRAGPDSAEGKRLIALFNARSADLASRLTSVSASAKAQAMTGETKSGIRFAYQSVSSGQMVAGTPWAVGASILWKNVIVNPVTLEMTIIDAH